MYVSCLDNKLNMSDTCIQYVILLGLINFRVSRINEVKITGAIDTFYLACFTKLSVDSPA